ncbi:hypothetical protein HWV62_44725 [Athelia sp. TMB]|nr:hypothetical protein HWV62_44725 [Athelia sp. TMB]
MADVRWNTADSIIDSVVGGYALRSSNATWREMQAASLQSHIDLLVQELALEDENIYVPRPIDFAIVRVPQSNKAGVLRAMATTRYYYMDLIAFYRWVRDAFDEELTYNGWDELQPPAPVWKTWWRMPVVGYLIDLKENIHSHNLPMWASHGVPVMYPWDAGMAEDVRYHYWNPAVMGALNETRLGVELPAFAWEQAVAEEEDEVYDEWMQNRSPSLANEFLDAGPLPNEGNVAYFIEDFEGWHLRQIFDPNLIPLFDQLYHFRDKRGATSISRTYFRWVERITDPEDICSLQLQYLAKPHQQALYYVRELYKFRYAPSAARSWNVRPLIERLGDSSQQQPAVVDMASPRGRSQRELPVVRAVTIRERSASPVLQSSSATSEATRDFLRLRGHHRSDSGSSSRSALSPIQSESSSSASQRRRTPELSLPELQGREAAASLVPFEENRYPEGFAKGGRWSKLFLEKVVLHFPEDRAQWRIRAWMLDEPRLSATALLDRALAFFLPIHLEIPAAIVHQFTKPLAAYNHWELAAGDFYRAERPDETITWKANGADYASNYRGSVLNLLNKPNAHAFLYEGGLLARIAYEYGGETLMARAKSGLSAAVTLHGAAATSIERTTKRESVSASEQLTLVGQSLPAPPKTDVHYIFPPAWVFNEGFSPYDGMWNEDCESWFQRIIKKIKDNAPPAKTDGGWTRDLRSARKKERIRASTWTHASQELMRLQGDSWEGKRLKDIISLAASDNDYLES